MSERVRCQSCGMPLDEGFYGSNEDFSENHEFCRFCFQEGAFTEPNLSLEAMIHRSIKHLMEELHLDHETAKNLAEHVIPHLNRWNSESKAL